MNAAKIAGKKITKVKQSFWKAEDGAHTPGWVLDWIELEDGSRLMFGVCEGEAEYGVEGVWYSADEVKGDIKREKDNAKCED